MVGSVKTWKQSERRALAATARDLYAMVRGGTKNRSKEKES